MTTAPSTGSSYRVTVTNWGSTATGTAQLQFNAIGEFKRVYLQTVNGM